MSFWNLSEGDFEVSEKFEIGGGEITPIPSNTQCLAYIDEAKWDQDRDQNRFISLRWTILGPIEYKNRKIFQKLWVEDDNPQAKDPEKKRDKAKRMLFAIDAYAGGKMAAQKLEPTDEVMQQCIGGKQMLIKVMVWKIKDESTGETKEGNWIMGVERKAQQQPMADVPF